MQPQPGIKSHELSECFLSPAVTVFSRHEYSELPLLLITKAGRDHLNLQETWASVGDNCLRIVARLPWMPE